MSKAFHDAEMALFAEQCREVDVVVSTVSVSVSFSFVEGGVLGTEESGRGGEERERKGERKRADFGLLDVGSDPWFAGAETHHGRGTSRPASPYPLQQY